MSNTPSFPILEPQTQIGFYYRLQEIQDQHLSDAFSNAVRTLSVSDLDSELLEMVNQNSLSKLASFGLRGETVFSVPSILNQDPKLLGYYRLLLGFSQKEFYKKPFSSFKPMEERGEIPEKTTPQIEQLCKSLIGSAEILVNGIDQFSVSIIRDLQLLTIGAQLRGSKNTELGKAATTETFTLIKDIVSNYIVEHDQKSITIKNDSQRLVKIEFSPDPDIRIAERISSGERPLISVEIKGGTDYSNIHNRLGEAEKSHQKARANGFFEFWTIINVDIDYNQARSASPTTSHFFQLKQIRDPQHEEYRKFRDILSSVLSIQASE